MSGGNQQPNHDGFSLIELVIALIIVAILAAVAIPQYSQYVLESKRTEALTTITELAAVMERYYYANGAYSDLVTNGNFASTTAEGLYVISVDTTAPTDGFTLTANATAGMSQVDDTGCTTLTLDSTGDKTPAECWK